jgi:hypothetical protein
MMKTRHKVIFNTSKLGWVHIDVPKVVDLFKNAGVQCFELNEEEVLGNYNSKSLSNVTAEYKGINLYNICIYSICNELKIFKTELNTDTHGAVINKWYSVAKNVIDYLIPIFDENSFSASIIFHGHMVVDACLLALSKRYQVPYLCIEATANKDRIVWDNVSGKVITYNMARNFFYKYDSLYHTKKVDDYCNSFINNIFSKKRDEHIASTQEKVVSVKKPFILFVAQVYNDASQLFTLDENISSPEEVIECVTNVAREIDCDLIIKLHPKEFNGKDPITREPYDHITYKRIKHLESEHTIIDYNNSYNTFELIKQSKMVVTVNSQAGLEACLFNKPVLTYSKGFYSNLGFTYDYSCKRDLRHLITNLIANEDTINRSLDEAKLFFYVFYEKYCIVRSSNSLVNKTLEIGAFQKPHILYKIWSKLKYKINV